VQRVPRRPRPPPGLPQDLPSTSKKFFVDIVFSRLTPPIAKHFDLKPVALPCV
jgi:hypothetical protein